MKIVFLTSTGLRHKYIAAQLAQHFELALIVTENKSEKIQETSNLSSKDATLIAQHFEKREKSEKEFFGDFSEFPGNSPLLELSHGGLNTPSELAQKVEDLQPDFIVLFGSSILKNPLLELYNEKVINLHLGLSPYYVGSGTNLFPFYFGEPECVGATIHLATEKVDEGGILQQLRPEIEVGDDLHRIGNKVILKAGKQLPGIIKEYNTGNLTPQSQLPPERICKIKDFTPEVLREIYYKLETGLVENYLQDKKGRDAERPIVQ